MTISEPLLPRTVVPAGILDPRESARAELKAALAAIEIKGNIPRRVEQASTRAVADARVFADRNPIAAIAAAVGIAAVVGGVVWAIARAVAR
ncbi:MULTISPECIES: hypothetical protein [unclassified Microbacterium]|uniref:hypothetical protein n=1 Tax=unclassified Microbacterium TaxID=2609290 RepID=UPI000EA8991D|nr:MULTISPECIES: hypothetical protein [unclassified Microbacterium]MBT2483730.1 hypothetical protein [Microbacterium sp. ISL-108]RKN66723.1 hypothetical protein D7252_03355 [Microbacterium sp. CGR2]